MASGTGKYSLKALLELIVSWSLGRPFWMKKHVTKSKQDKDRGQDNHEGVSKDRFKDVPQPSIRPILGHRKFLPASSWYSDAESTQWNQIETYV